MSLYSNSYSAARVANRITNVEDLVGSELTIVTLTAIGWMRFTRTDWPLWPATSGLNKIDAPYKKVTNRSLGWINILMATESKGLTIFRVVQSSLSSFKQDRICARLLPVRPICCAAACRRSTAAAHSKRLPVNNEHPRSDWQLLPHH